MQTIQRIVVIIVFFLFSCAHASRSAKPETSQPTLLSATVDLSNWSVENAQQIRYVSLTIQHHPKGERLLVTDIRRHEPLVERPDSPQSEAPELVDNVFVISHFLQGNVNRLGGAFNEFYRSPSRATTAIETIAKGSRALMLSFDNQKTGYAGLWIHLFRTLDPPQQRIYLDLSDINFIVFSIRGEKGGESLDLNIADRIWERKEDSIRVGSIGDFIPSGRITRQWQQAWIPLDRLPAQINRRELAVLAFAVSKYASGRVYIKDLAVAATKADRIPPAKVRRSGSHAFGKALWLWTTSEVNQNDERRNALIDFCKKEGITDVFMQLPYSAEKNDGEWIVDFDRGAIGSLIAQLNKAGVKVDALDGDPRYALAIHHSKVLAVVRAVSKYNKRVSPERRFRGLRFDIEPYLLPEYGGKKTQGILRQYLELLRKSRRITQRGGLAFGVDIPFWFDERNKFFERTSDLDGRPFSQWIIDTVDNLSIMDYRTKAYGPDGVIAHGRDELEYAAKRGKQVYIGLETVKLPDETIHEFGAQGHGPRIAIRPTRGASAQIVFLSEADWRAIGARIKKEKDTVVLGRIARTEVPADKLTFADRDPSDLDTAMRHTVFELGELKSFRGFAIHSYESYRPWLLSRQKR